MSSPEHSDARSTVVGWLLILFGAIELWWVFFGSDDGLGTWRSIAGLITGPLAIALGFWKVSGASDDE